MEGPKVGSRKRKTLVVLFILIASVAVFAGHSLRAAERKAKKSSEASPPASKSIKIDLDKAVAVTLPTLKQDLQPVTFKTSDGKSGWVVRLPGDRPIATPAYANGRLFVGGGYGSHEFYAFDAATGAMVWQMKTSDDGPTAAVVQDNYVAFNTESCTLIVTDARTGKVVWEEWLGDPLMSQPAISKGRVYMAYPAGQRGGNRRVPVKPKTSKRVKVEEAGSHRLLCADLKTGEHLWDRGISGDVISAPVISDGKVYFTTFDGTSYSLDANNGRTVWTKQNASTSAPVVVAGEVVVSQKEERNQQAYEGLKVLDAKAGSDKDKRLLTREKAAYLSEDSGGGVALNQQAQTALDSSVGFGTAPAAAELSKANKHLGVRTVVGGWAYQGSRAAYSKGRFLNAQGKYLNSVNAGDGAMAWRAEVSGAGVSENAHVFSPPALGDEFMYLSSSLGHLLSVRQSDGNTGFAYLFGQPMVFQPALAEGNVYVGTSNGLLICLKTGSADADGWYAWGGNAEHNKSK
jgi:Ca-activated chloride channel homolog